MKNAVLLALCILLSGCGGQALRGQNHGGQYESDQGIFTCRVPVSGSSVRMVDSSSSEGDSVTFQKGFQDLYRVDAFRRFGHMISMVPVNEDPYKEASDAVNLLNSVMLEPSFGELEMHVSRPVLIDGRHGHLQIATFDSGRGMETRGFLVQVSENTVSHMHYSHFELRGASHAETIESRLTSFAKSCSFE